VSAGNALNNADRAAFHEQAANHQDLFYRKTEAFGAIHGSFAKSPLASRAMPALRTVAVLAKLAGFDFACVALHNLILQQPVAVVDAHMDENKRAYGVFVGKSVKWKVGSPHHRKPVWGYCICFVLLSYGGSISGTSFLAAQRH
jgi:hypothetical protein